MSCIKIDIIQKYIDGEATLDEVVRIENHILTCEKCAAKVEQQRRLAGGVKRAINLLTEDTVEIPAIAVPNGHSKKHFFSAGRIVAILAAACILLFIVVISHKKNSENQSVIIIEPGFASDIDANLPVSQQSLVITIIDSEGNVSEYFN